MKVIANETREVQVLQDITCDLCGKSCRDDSGLYEYATLSASWSYGSHKDGETWEAHICEKCVDALPFVGKIRRRETLVDGEGVGEWQTGKEVQKQLRDHLVNCACRTYTFDEAMATLGLADDDLTKQMEVDHGTISGDV